MDGYYLFKNTTMSYGVEVTFTSCVQDCPAASPLYVNDPIHAVCQYCGENCASCTLQFGCSACASGSLGYGYSVVPVEYS